MIDLIGTIREVDPQETLQRALTPAVWQTVGLTRLADITGLDHIGIHTFIAIRPNSKCLATSQGKGVTKDLAKVSALMEAIELWHGEEVRPPTLYGSYRELKTNYCVRNFSALEGYSPFRTDDFETVPMSWIEGRDLLTDTPAFVPWSLCSMDFTRMPPEARYLSGSSNGLASGNSVEEALCHALFEVVEREAEAAFQRVPLASRIVDHGTIDSMHVRDLLDACTRSGLAVYTFDMTDKIPIPTYRALIKDSEQLARNVGIFTGTGTHLSPDIALSRALTEAIQGRLTVISGSRDDMTPELYLNFRREQFNEKVLEGAVPLPFRTRTEPLPGSFSGWIAEILRHLAEAGFHEATYIDLTNDAVGIPVVKVLIPGCRMDMSAHNPKRVRL